MSYNKRVVGLIPSWEFPLESLNVVPCLADEKLIVLVFLCHLLVFRLGSDLIYDPKDAEMDSSTLKLE